MNVHKTLIGKNGYLFLQNDSANEIQRHLTNESVILDKSLAKFDKVIDKYFITIFPNKSFACRSKLPDGYDLKHRPDFDVYQKKFGDHLLDGYEVLGDDVENYYKTDTHLNLKGSILIHYEFLKRINMLFGLNIEYKQYYIESKTTNNLSERFCLGDLTSPFNLGDQTITDTSDVYFYSKNIFDLYSNIIIKKEHEINYLKLENNEIKDLTDKNIGRVFDWFVVGEYILYKKNYNKPKHKVLIFYDSFLLQSLRLYFDLFEVYFVKSVYDSKWIDKIKPGYVFEFRVERFLF
jgi:hypothetical protein